MPKPSTSPILFDNTLQINITKLKKQGFLKPNAFNAGTLNWSSSGNVSTTISIVANTVSPKSYIELDYGFYGKPINYRLNIIAVPSNLGKGKIWYFICPVTNKRCRKIYLEGGGYFLHREAHKWSMYSCQTDTKTFRKLRQRISITWDGMEFDQLNQKHFKKFYKGKPTKRYLRILNKINKARRVSYNHNYFAEMAQKLSVISTTKEVK